MEGGCHREDGGVFQAPGAFVQGCLVVVRKAYGVQSRLQLLVENRDVRQSAPVWQHT